MKTRTSPGAIILMLAILCISFASCEKSSSDEEVSPEEEEFAVTTITAEAESEASFSEVFDNVIGVNSELAFGGTGVFAGDRFPGEDGPVNGPDSVRCFTVSITPLTQGSTFPVQVVIDFGAGCTGRDGVTRKGKIITTYTNRLIFPSAEAISSFDGYEVNNVKVEGTHRILNTSTQNSPSFQVTIDGKLSKANGNYSSWKSTRSIKMTQGFSTPHLPADDIFELTGSASAKLSVDNRIREWSTVVMSPLIKKFNCRWVVSGQVSLKRNDSGLAVLDYGNGECDKIATLTVRNRVVIISLD